MDDEDHYLLKDALRFLQAADGFYSRHLKSAEELHEWRSTPKTESLVASAVHWAERIMRKIDSTFGKP
jgi:hypothetical protein